jgi:hypothetical protein
MTKAQLETIIYSTATRAMMKGYGLNYFRETGIPQIIEAVRVADIKKCDNCSKSMQKSLCRDCQMLEGLSNIFIR